jgi:enoyl-CoA hydratase/carnithine racemase
MNDSPPLLVGRDDGVMSVVLNRPDRHNPLSRAVLAALQDAMQQASSDDTLRCVLLRGAGNGYFAAGGDLRDLSSVRSTAETEVMVVEARGALDAVRECPVPVIAVINGDALGGGAELAVACDLRIMAAHARIGYMHGRLNVSTGWGGGTDLFDLVGRARALRMLSRAEMVHAADALAWGLADAVAPSEADLDAFAAGFIEPMRRQSPRLMRAYKAQALARRRGDDREARRTAEMRDFIDSWIHDDHWQAVERILSRSSQNKGDENG